jgi:proliferating cell nuclear antigen
MNSISAEVFKGMLSCIKDFKNEASFTLNEKDLSVMFVDSNNILIVNAVIKRSNNESSDKYININGVKANKISIDLNKLNVILKMSKSGTISMISEESCLKVKIKENKKNINTKTDLLLIEETSFNVEDIKHTHVFSMSYADFSKIIKDSSNFGNSCNITLKNNNLVFSSSGDNGTYSCEIEDVEFIEYGPEEISEKFDTNYLLKIIKSVSSEKITVKLSKQSLLSLKIMYDDLSYIEFFMAPKVD